VGDRVQYGARRQRPVQVRVWSGGAGTMKYRIKLPGTAYNATGYSATITFTVG
jgi:hypothetical protein